uniref:Ubiquitin-like domain-containing protein n=1 Tax=Araucaria cunninghamii TaxID=56994 RepID=A0A0D6R169_ARACU
MMRRSGSKGSFAVGGGIGSSAKARSDGAADAIDWEMRPGGMLVQKRDPNADPKLKPPPNVKLRVTYGSMRLEISINLQTTFGELKKLLAVETGLQPNEQRLIFRGKERDSNDFLDISGVKDKSKIVLIEDPSSRERKYIEMKRNAKIEMACKAISEICGEVDKLAEQVSTLEGLVNNGKKVTETDIVALTEFLMRQLVKLDGITADGDAKAQRRLQVRRVQKCIETLDALKVRNAMPKSLLDHPVMTTKWETFEPAPPPNSTSSATANWELFD